MPFTIFPKSGHTKQVAKEIPIISPGQALHWLSILTHQPAPPWFTAGGRCNLTKSFYYPWKTHKFPEARAMCASQTPPLTEYTAFKGSQLPQAPLPSEPAKTIIPEKPTPT